MKKQYKICGWLKPIKVNGQLYSQIVEIPRFTDPAYACTYGEKLMKSGVFIGFTVRFFDEEAKDWFRVHEKYCKMPDKELIAKTRPFCLIVN
jgi:hypothetical protein